MKTKKKKHTALIVILSIIGSIIAVFGLFISIGLNLKDAVIKDVDISKLPDGIYDGQLTGSRFGNSLSVTVSGGKITDIKITKDMFTASPDLSAQLFGEVIENQSIDIDSVSGASVSSKAYLKSLEDALSGE